jgi:HAE1 family hydrophobic/amphiphilic exporter-1
MEEVKAELPAGYSLTVQRDGSAVIRTGTAAVTEHLVLGALLAAIVVLMFLGNLRSSTSSPRSPSPPRSSAPSP